MIRRAYLIIWLLLAGYGFCIFTTIVGAMLDLRDAHGERMYPMKPGPISGLLKYVREYEALLDSENEKCNS